MSHLVRGKMKNQPWIVAVIVSMVMMGTMMTMMNVVVTVTIVSMEAVMSATTGSDDDALKMECKERIRLRRV